MSPSPKLRQRLLRLLAVGLAVLGPVTACCGSKERVPNQELCYDQPRGETSACAPIADVSSSAWRGPWLKPTDGQSRAAYRECETSFTSGPVRRDTFGGKHDCCYRADVTYCPKGGRPLFVRGAERTAGLCVTGAWRG